MTDLHRIAHRHPAARHGWIAKLQCVQDRCSTRARHWPPTSLAVIAAVNTVISAAYYMTGPARDVDEAEAPDGDTTPIRTRRQSVWAALAIICTAGTVVLGLVPGLVLRIRRPPRSHQRLRPLTRTPTLLAQVLIARSTRSATFSARDSMRPEASSASTDSSRRRCTDPTASTPERWTGRSPWRLHHLAGGRPAVRCGGGAVGSTPSTVRLGRPDPVRRWSMPAPGRARLMRGRCWPTGAARRARTVDAGGVRRGRRAPAAREPSRTVSTSTDGGLAERAGRPFIGVIIANELLDNVPVPARSCTTAAGARRT